MRWLELSVEADAEAVEPISEIFGRGGYGSVVRPTRLRPDPGDEQGLLAVPDAPFLISAHIPDDPAAAAAIDRTRRALWHLQAFGLRPIGELTVRPLEEADWVEAWKEGYRPQRIGRLLIVPSWLDEPGAEGEVAVRLDPGMAFGTGLHPSTRACLEIVESMRPIPARVLDVGCGSGILAIAALALGASRARCHDTDPAAVEATRANAARNGVARRLTVVRGSLPAVAARRFGLVLANLVAGVLVELAPRLADHLDVGGPLVASGIITEREAEVAAAFQRAGLVIRDRRADGDWVTLVATHRVA